MQSMNPANTSRYDVAANQAIDLQSGMVFAVPIAKEHAMDDKLVGDAINTAIRESV